MYTTLNKTDCRPATARRAPPSPARCPGRARAGWCSERAGLSLQRQSHNERARVLPVQVSAIVFLWRVFSSRFGGKRWPMAGARRAHWRRARGRAVSPILRAFSRSARDVPLFVFRMRPVQKCNDFPLHSLPSTRACTTVRVGTTRLLLT